MGIEQLRKELNQLQISYEKKSRKFSKSACIPPAIKGDALGKISSRMDKIESELQILSKNCDGCKLLPAGPYCTDCRWYTK